MMSPAPTIPAVLARDSLSFNPDLSLSETGVIEGFEVAPKLERSISVVPATVPTAAGEICGEGKSGEGDGLGLLGLGEGEGIGDGEGDLLGEGAGVGEGVGVGEGDACGLGEGCGFEVP